MDIPESISDAEDTYISINGEYTTSIQPRMLMDTTFELPLHYQDLGGLQEGSFGVKTCLAYSAIKGGGVTVKKFEGVVKNYQLMKALVEVQISCLLRDMGFKKIFVQLVDVIIPMRYQTQAELNEKVRRREFTDLYLVYQNGLLDDLKSILGNIKEREKIITHHREIISQVALALEQLHTADITHQDLKPDQVFLTTDRSTVQLSGFGSSSIGRGASYTDFEDFNLLSIEEKRRKLRYASPEALLECADYRCHPSIDVWALGCIMAELLSDGKPFFELPEDVPITPEEQLKLIVSNLIPKECDFDFIASTQKRREAIQMIKDLNAVEQVSLPKSDLWSSRLLDKVLAFDPRKRYTLKEVISDPYVKTTVIGGHVEKRITLKESMAVKEAVMEHGVTRDDVPTEDEIFTIEVNVDPDFYSVKTTKNWIWNEMLEFHIASQH